MSESERNRLIVEHQQIRRHLLDARAELRQLLQDLGNPPADAIDLRPVHYHLDRIDAQITATAAALGLK